MTPQHRRTPVRTGSAVRRAVVTSVLSALALTSVTITAAAVTLTNASPHPESPAAAEATSTPPAEADLPLAPPVAVEDVPVGIPDGGIPEIALVAADGVQLDAVPSTATAAYQRAAAVLGTADKGCHLEWTLTAAVGQVVSGHGSTAGSELDQRGIMRPTLTGKPLLGRDGKRVPDSDAGRLDGDKRFDRPVGPLQLSPATWAVVGVDSDGDDRRNPHDIDDAALAVSVLLCSGDGDLRQRAGRVDAVRRINDGRSFIETVLATDRAYRTQLSESYDADPVVVPAATSVDPPSDLPPINVKPGRDKPKNEPSDPSGFEPSSPTATDPVTPLPTPRPPTSTQPPRDPTDLPRPCNIETDEPTDPATAEPSEVPTDATDLPTDLPTDSPTDLPTDGKPGCEDDEGDPTDP